MSHLQFSIPNFRSAILPMFLLASLGFQPLVAQSLHGRLLDLDTDSPIPFGFLEFFGEGGNPVATVRADENGVFRLKAPEAGVYMVKASRLGYRSWIDGPVELGEDDNLEVEFHLSKAVFALDPIEISAQADARYLNTVGFYERQRSDFGHFVTREQIAHRQPRRMTDLVATVPGVRLVPLPASAGKVQVQMRGSNLSQGSLCRPRVFVDGLIAIRGGSGPRRLGGGDVGDIGEEEGPAGSEGSTEPNIDDVVVPEEIEAIEVYRSAAQVPAKFGGAGAFAQCGVIAVWTRRGVR